MQYNLIGEYCALLILFVLFFLNISSNYDKSIRKKLFSFILVFSILHTFCNICRYSFSNVNIHYFFMFVYHILFAILQPLIMCYCLSLTPMAKSTLIKSVKFFVILYSLGILIIISSPFTHLVYYIDNGVIMSGPLDIISFIEVYIGTIYTMYNIVTKKIMSKSAVINISCSAFVIFFCTFIEFINRYLVISGLGIAVAMIILFHAFNFLSYEISYGLEKKYSLEKEIKRLHSKKYSVVVLRINNLKYLTKSEKEKKLISLFKLFKKCENEYIAPKIFLISDDTFVFLSKNSNKDNILFFIDYLKTNLMDSELNENSKIDFNIIYMISPFVVFDIEKISKLFNDNVIKEISEKEVSHLERRESLEKEIEDILNKNNGNDPRVEVFYQPILDNDSNKFLSAEALSRLNIPSLGGLIFPDEFIPILEEKNYIRKYSLIVLNKVCLFIKLLEQMNTNFEGISVNFSMLEFSSSDFEKDIKTVVMNNNINPSRIHIEITESQASLDMSEIKDKVKNLKSCGFKFYLDDFGTGYSNFIEVMDIPFDIIKFDKSLIDRAVSDESVRFIVENLSSMFSSYGLNTLFEGIENNEYQNLAKDLNINFSQGYNYSKPIPGDKVLEFFGKDNA